MGAVKERAKLNAILDRELLKLKPVELVKTEQQLEVVEPVMRKLRNKK